MMFQTEQSKGRVIYHEGAKHGFGDFEEGIMIVGKLAQSRDVYEGIAVKNAG